MGCDICKNRAVFCCLKSLPANIRQHWQDIKGTAAEFHFNSDGIAKFLKIRPDAIVLEPTGYHYSEFLNKVCIAERIQVFWVNHRQIRHYREGHRLPNKNDFADSYALACYFLENRDIPEAFLHFYPGNSRRLRELSLQLHSLNRMQSPMINRIRQQLAIEFPEVALIDSAPGVDQVSPLWGWLAEEPISPLANSIYSNKWNSSIAPKYGEFISPFTRGVAKSLCHLQRLQVELENQLLLLLDSEEFAPYVQVLSQFGLGTRTQSLIISQIYPVDRFPSISQFKRRLGVAGEENSSGDKKVYRTSGGSKICRSQLYLWALTRIAPRKARPNTEIGQKIGTYYDSQREKYYRGRLPGDDHGSGNLIIMKSVGYAIKLLWRELNPLK